MPLGFFRSYRDFNDNKSKVELDALKSNYIDLCVETIFSGMLLKEKGGEI